MTTHVSGWTAAVLAAAMAGAGASAAEFAPLDPPENPSQLGAHIQRTMTLLATSTPEKRNRVRVLFYGQSVTRNPWWQDVATYLRTTYPELMAACAPEADAFVHRLRDWEHGRPHDPAELTRLFTALHNAMIAAVAPRRDVHLTIPTEPGTRRWTIWRAAGCRARWGS